MKIGIYVHSGIAVTQMISSELRDYSIHGLIFSLRTSDAIQNEASDSAKSDKLVFRFGHETLKYFLNFGSV